ncbi:hypothetical protein HYPSUDRAFT_1071961 [Hypholoma sublateritium FD-334 SS-4]|uniref:Mid2 domain-containing protein n=1 Tax=Hypholoma sublateritium (strain FD-334 SS-4) TaxID=945553 RepID=A0A0D2ND91_HYPSF|nr:hypothetical protein HYPSUDRAFT_1071961 [Hypholoma sublateritium FD-334 SS-4]
MSEGPLVSTVADGMLVPQIKTLILRGVYAYTWSFEEDPSQCGQLTVAITGNDGTPPFHILIAPFGPSPLPNGVETRGVLDIPFAGSQREVQFQLTYPASSQFVAVVSDASSFASGGTSVATMVKNSNDSSCFDATSTVQFDFVFNISPIVNQVVQCKALRIWWDPTMVQGTPNFLGIIPGGQSFIIQEGSITTDSTGNTGTGFSWTPSLRAGTTFLLTGGDPRGNGTGGAVSYVVALGNDVDSCLSNNSPSSTPGSPAGGSIPTSTPGSTTGASVPTLASTSGSVGSSTSTSVGATTGVSGGGLPSATVRTIAIVSVVGGVVIVVVLALVYILRRRNRAQGLYGRRRDGVPGEGDSDGTPYPTGGMRSHRQAHAYQPSPFVLGDLGPNSWAARGFAPPQKVYESFGGSTSAQTLQSGGTSSGRASHMINYVPRNDDGPNLTASQGSAQELAVTIDMPPAYAVDLRRARVSM